MNEIHSDIYHICKTNIDVIELEIFKFIKVTLLLFFPSHVFKFKKIFHTPIKIDPIPDIEESIYYTLHSPKIYLQIGFPKNSPLHGTVIIYQLNLRLENNEIWISNLGEQIQPPQQELIPLIILAPLYIQLPPHGPRSGA